MSTESPTDGPGSGDLFDVDPDDVRDAINDEDDGGIPAGKPTPDGGEPRGSTGE